MIPALASSLNSAILSSVMSSPDWGISQKLDGIRLLLNKSGENVSGHNRVFETRSIPIHIEEQFVKFPGDWLFDGELVGDTYTKQQIHSPPNIRQENHQTAHLHPPRPNTICMKHLWHIRLILLAILITNVLFLIRLNTIGREFHGFIENIKLTLRPK